MKKFFLVLFFISSISFSMEISSNLVSSNVNFSDPFEYKLTLEGDDKQNIIWPQFNDFDPLFVKDIKHSGDTVSYFLVAFNVGEQLIPTLTIVNSIDQSKNVIVASRFIYVSWPDNVVSKNLSFIDVKDPMKLPYSFFDVLLFLLPWIVIVAFVYFIYRRRAKNIVVLEKKIDVYKYVIDELKKIEVIDDEDTIKQLCFKVSELVRQYLADSISNHALEMTTIELNNKMKHDNIDNSLRIEFQKILSYCDEVKFAAFNSCSQDVSEIINKACDVITMTNETIKHTEEE